MEQRPTWETDSRSATIKIGSIYRTRSVVTVFIRTHLCILYRARLIQSTSHKPSFTKGNFNIILTSTPRFPKLSLFFRFSY